jgi:hypothetical protein
MRCAKPGSTGATGAISDAEEALACARTIDARGATMQTLSLAAYALADLDPERVLTLVNEAIELNILPLRLAPTPKASLSVARSPRAFRTRVGGVATSRTSPAPRRGRADNAMHSRR